MFLLAMLLAWPVQILQNIVMALGIAVGGPVYLVAQLVEKIAELF